HWRSSGLRGGNVSAPDFADWHDQATSFDGLAAYVGGQSSVTVNAAGDYIVVARATPDFFRLLAARTALGRLPDDAEQRDGAPTVVVVSYAFWLSHLGGDSSAIGRPIKYRERVYTVVGVLTPEFRFPGTTDVWVPWWTVPATQSRSAHNYRVVGRLKA